MVQGNLRRSDALRLAAAMEVALRDAGLDVANMMNDNNNNNNNNNNNANVSVTVPSPPLRALLYRPSNWQPVAAQDACLVPGLSGMLGACGTLL